MEGVGQTLNTIYKGGRGEGRRRQVLPGKGEQGRKRSVLLRLRVVARIDLWGLWQSAKTEEVRRDPRGLGVGVPRQGPV